MSAHKARLAKELEMLAKDPPPGVTVWPEREDEHLLHARLTAPASTPYIGGCFELEIRLGARYPFEAPSVRFVTKIFHPNIDESGRICLDSLKLPPSGSWRPSLNLAQVLSQITILLSEPGLSDPLMKDIAELYKNDRERFNQIATEWTLAHALPDAKRVKTSETSERNFGKKEDVTNTRKESTAQDRSVVTGEKDRAA